MGAGRKQIFPYKASTCAHKARFFAPLVYSGRQMKLWEEISETGFHITNPIPVSPCVKPAFNLTYLLRFCFLVWVSLSKGKSMSWAMQVLLAPCGRDSAEAESFPWSLTTLCKQRRPVSGKSKEKASKWRTNLKKIWRNRKKQSNRACTTPQTTKKGLRKKNRRTRSSSQQGYGMKNV